MQAFEDRCVFFSQTNLLLKTENHFQAITALGMGIALLLVARRIVLGTASVGDVPMVQGAVEGSGDFRIFGWIFDPW